MGFNIFTVAHWLRDKEFPLRLHRMAPQDPCITHCHEFTELVVFYSGRGDNVVASGGTLHAAAGDVLVIPPGVSHRYEALEELCLVNLLFELKLLPLPLLDIFAMPGFNQLFNGELRLFHLEAAELSRMMGLLERLESCMSAREPGHQFEAMALFMLVLHLAAQAVGAGTGRTASASVAGALAVLHQRYADPALGMEEVAAAAKMSLSSLLRHFKRRTGCAPKAYLLKLRVQAACALLTSSSLAVSEVAARCGFEDSNYFSREFKRQTKLTPTEFRRSGGGKNIP